MSKVSIANLSKTVKKTLNIHKINILGFYNKDNDDQIRKLESLLEICNVKHIIHPNKMSYNNPNFSFVLFPHRPATPFKKYDSYFMRPFNPHVIIADKFVDINDLDFVQNKDPLIPFINIKCLKSGLFYHMLWTYLEMHKYKFNK